MLSGYRVLDLTNERGLLCCQILGDLGADVIKVEPPGGSSARKLGPFYQDQPDPNRSLLWWAYNRNKRGITLDISSEAGAEIFRRLLAIADFVLESDRPGRLADSGFGYDAVARLNPRIVYVSISPFGQDGPKALYHDCDLILMAAGGPMVLTGDADRPPIYLSVPQAFLHASVEAAAGAIIAFHELPRSRSGQLVDVS